jgi:hypothetical protein
LQRSALDRASRTGTHRRAFVRFAQKTLAECRMKDFLWSTGGIFMQGISFSSNRPSIGPEPLSPVKVTPGPSALGSSSSGSSTSSASKALESGGEATVHLTSAVDPDPVIKFTAVEAKEQGGSSAPPLGSDPPGRIDIGEGVGHGGGTAGQPSAEFVGRSALTAAQQGVESTETLDSLTESPLGARIDLLA